MAESARCCRASEELERSPEHVHTYRLSVLALWNAASLGVTADEVLEGLAAISRFEIPPHVVHEVREAFSRHGVCRLLDGVDSSSLWLEVDDAALRTRLERDPKLAPRLRRDGDRFALAVLDRGPIKRGLLGLGYPVEDVAGMVEGAPLALATRHDVFTPYPYQTAAVEAFTPSGHGVIVLPCGAGKTVIGLLAIEALATRTLILASNREAAAQWKRELRAKSDLAEDQVVVYEGAKNPRLGAVTIATYSVTSKRGGAGTDRVRALRSGSRPSPGAW